VDVVPDDGVVHAGGQRSADHEHKSSIKLLSQQCTDFVALCTVRQEGQTHRATKPLTGIWMFPRLNATGNGVCDPDGFVSLVSRQ